MANRRNKKGDLDLVSNYRPISLIPIFSKIYEKIVYNRLYDHLTKNKYLYTSQFGFQKNCSTEHALIELSENIVKSFEKNLYTLGVFIDLSKAFDTVNHLILFEKLKHYGIKNKLLKWLKNYLSNRKQYVLKKSSGLENFLCGVPQGSILGPLLFLIYINDMYKASDQIKTITFADDTNLFISHTKIRELFASANLQLEHYNTWFKANKLSINIDKTNYILFHKKTQRDNLPLKLPKLNINNTEVKKVDKTKFLGITIDENLSWKPHIHHLESRLSRVIGLIYRSRTLLNLKARKHIYFSLVYSHLSYSNIVWGSTNSTILSVLESKHKHICKAMIFKKKRDSAKEAMKSLDLLTLKNINVVLTSLFMYKNSKGLLPMAFKELFSQKTTKYNLRSTKKGVITLPKNTCKHIEQSLSYRGPKLWNNLSEDIKSSKNSNTFKKLIKNSLSVE